MDKRNQIKITDDNFYLTMLISELRKYTGLTQNKDIVAMGILQLIEKYNHKIPKEIKHIADSLTHETFKDSDRNISHAMWKHRNLAVILVDMIMKGLSNETIDEKRRIGLERLKFNFYEPHTKKKIINMNHKTYDFIRERIKYERQKGLKDNEIKMIGFEGLLKFKRIPNENTEQSIHNKSTIDITPIRIIKKKPKGL